MFEMHHAFLYWHILWWGEVPFRRECFVEADKQGRSYIANRWPILGCDFTGTCLHLLRSILESLSRHRFGGASMKLW